MKKITVALDGLNFSESAVRYGIYLAEKAHAKLTGAFLDDFTRHSYKVYDLVDSGAAGQARLKESSAADDDSREQSVITFRKLCNDAGIEYDIHHNNYFAMWELLNESIYADLLILDRKETFSYEDDRMPTHFIRDTLANVECPVLLVPEFYSAPDKVILLYDGSPSSVYAIKIYAYLFQDCLHLPVQVLTVRHPNHSQDLSGELRMKDWLGTYFPKVTYEVLKGDPEIKISWYIRLLENECLVVLGAYQRSQVSRWFRESMADNLMKKLQMPLFIAHHK